jgi:hypothetical protein
MRRVHGEKSLVATIKEEAPHCCRLACAACCLFMSHMAENNNAQACSDVCLCCACGGIVYTFCKLMSSCVERYKPQKLP